MQNLHVPVTIKAGDITSSQKRFVLSGNIHAIHKSGISGI
jgi:hypothetical protein